MSQLENLIQRLEQTPEFFDFLTDEERSRIERIMRMARKEKAQNA